MSTLTERLAKKWCPEHGEGKIVPGVPYPICACALLATAIREALEEVISLCEAERDKFKDAFDYGDTVGDGVFQCARNLAAKITALKEAS